jgi:hypothetical protein
MITKAQKKLIADAYNSFRGLDNITHTAYRDEIFNLEKKYEKQHRNYCSGRVFGLSVSDAAKYWTVRHLIDAFRDPETYTTKDYLHVKKSVFNAQAVVLNYGDKMASMVEGFNVEAFDALDYSDLAEA